MDGMIKVKVYVSTRFIKSQDETEVEVGRDFWGAMNDSERKEYMLDVMFEMIDWGFYEVEEGE